MKYALICAMTLPVFTSCHMLDEDTFGAATVEDMLKNEENVVSLVGQAYADLRFMHDHWGYWGVNTLTADEGLCPVRVGGDWNDGGYWKNLNTHNWNSYGKAFLNIWNCTVAGSVLCNNILETLYISTTTGLEVASDTTRVPPALVSVIVVCTTTGSVSTIIDCDVVAVCLAPILRPVGIKMISL